MSVLKVKHPINGIENSTEEGNTGENFPEMRERWMYKLNKHNK